MLASRYTANVQSDKEQIFKYFSVTCFEKTVIPHSENSILAIKLLTFNPAI